MKALQLITFRSLANLLDVRCISFYRESNRRNVDTGPYAGQKLWVALDSRLLAEADMTDGRVQQDCSKYFYAADLLYRKLKDLPHGMEALLDILILMFPCLKRQCVCDMFPEGLGSPAIDKFSEEALNDLIRPMEDTVMFQQLKAGGKQQVADAKAARKKAIATAKARIRKATKAKAKRGFKKQLAKIATVTTKKGKRVGGKTKPPPQYQSQPVSSNSAPVTSTDLVPRCDIVEEVSDGKLPILEHIYVTADYLMKKDDRQKERIEVPRIMCNGPINTVRCSLRS